MNSVKHFLRLFFAAAFAAAIAGCASPESKSTGDLMDDVAITAKVKSAFIKDPDISAAEINVDTYKGKVVLSGFVSDSEDVRKAGELVRDIEGVRSVTSDLHVK
ncbi:MAG TPA: BON domain-containing protein [Burkholderiales bacterium]|nr:BON domain-containing protein [Burkholderiales bacterium]